MKILNVLAFQILFISLIHSQWNRIYTYPGSSSGFFQSIYFTNEQTGFIVNYDSSIIKTTDGGLNWYTLNGTSNYFLKEIQFTSQNTGFAVGGTIEPRRGHFLRTTNSGENWDVQIFNFYFSSFKFINNNTGYIITDSNVILKTNNSGYNWAVYFVNASILNSVDFFDSNNGFVSAAYGKFLRTTNGGNNWFLYNTPWLYSIDFINQNLGFGVSYSGFSSIVYKTLNGGMNWFNIYSHDSVFIGKPFFIDSSNGWLGGFILKSGNFYNRVILKTTNSGISWFEQYTGSQFDSSTCISSIFMLNENTGYASSIRCQVQNEPALNPMLFKTTNGGGEPIGINNHGTIINDFILYQNYPNPFNLSTKIEFSIAANEFVSLKIYDIQGREVRSLINGNLNSGKYSILFNASSLSSGTYLYKIITSSFSDSKKMLLLK